jgi:2,3-bisphosphoglycerate-independent phosphoglycerate mutase
MASSPQVATYDLQPEMSAAELTEKVLIAMRKKVYNFVCVNYANPDMVGHTGVYEAIVKAVETIDACLKDVVETGLANGFELLVIADHGNADFAINPDGSPNTAHSLNPVPFVVVDNDIKKVRSGILADVAPTVLSILGVDQPVEMTGESLIVL